MKTQRTRLGIYIGVKGIEGGNFQYVQFIMDALKENLDKYIVKVIGADEGFIPLITRYYSGYETIICKVAKTDIPRFIDKLNLDFVLIPFSTMNCWIGTELETPVIGVIHDVNYFFMRDYYDNRRHLVTDYVIHLYQKLLRKSVGIFVDSPLGRNELVDVFGKIYANKIYELPYRAPDYLDSDAPEEECPLKFDKYMFYPAQIWPPKNHLNLIIALEQLKQDGIIVNLVITGEESPERVRLERIIDKLGLKEQIQLIGRVTDAQMKYLYKHARGMIFMGYHGPTNIPVYEAMYTKCPMAISNVRAMPWQAGNSALYFDPKYPDSIGAMIKRIWTDDVICSELVKKGEIKYKEYDKDRFNQRFNNAFLAIIENYANIYQSILEVGDFCKDKDLIFLYGAGEYACWMLRFLMYKEIEVDDILVSDGRENHMTFGGHRVITFSDFVIPMCSFGIIICTNLSVQSDIMKGLQNMGIKESQCLYMDSRLYEDIVFFMSDMT